MCYVFLPLFPLVLFSLSSNPPARFSDAIGFYLPILYCFFLLRQIYFILCDGKEPPPLPSLFPSPPLFYGEVRRFSEGYLLVPASSGSSLVFSLFFMAPLSFKPAARVVGVVCVLRRLTLSLPGLFPRMYPPAFPSLPLLTHSC